MIHVCLINNVYMETSALLCALFLCESLLFSFERESWRPSCPSVGGRIPVLQFGGSFALWGESSLFHSCAEPGTEPRVPPQRWQTSRVFPSLAVAEKRGAICLSVYRFLCFGTLNRHMEPCRISRNKTRPSS